jgi:hypothetical protein
MKRRLRPVGAVVAVLSMALAGALASADQAMSQTAESFRDTFQTISFSGNDGTQNWSGSWQESGESDGATSGSVRVTSSDRCSGGSGSCLRIGSDGASIENRSVRRVADLTDATSASMSLRYRRETQGQASGSVAVQVSRNGGASWNTLQTIDLAGAKNSATITFDISPYMASNTAVRFVGSGASVVGYLHIDDVEVSANIVGPATTTTTIASPSTTTTVVATTTTTVGASPTSTTTSSVGVTTTTAAAGTSVPSSPASTTTTVVAVTTTTNTSGESVVTMPPALGTSPPAVQSDGESLITSQSVASEASTHGELHVGVMTTATTALAENAASAGMLLALLSVLTLAGVEHRRDETGNDE